MLKKVIGVLLLSLGIILIHYYVPRDQGWRLIGAYIVSFSGFLLLSKIQLKFKQVFIIGIVVRLLLFFGTPSLSDDFYRFVWDGQLIHEGIHPFSSIPSELHTKGLIQQDEMYDSLNSKDYFTIYPPISQLVFWLSANGNSLSISVLIMRFVLLVFDLGIMIILCLLIKYVHRISWYALNPLVILELVGNLHFEGIMLFFVLLSIYSISQGRVMLSGASIGLAISVKLVPLILIPAFLSQLDWKRFFELVIITTSVVILCFIPLWNASLVHGMMNSLDLFFRSFEFNASIFFLVRFIGFKVVNYDIIQVASPILTIVGGLLILVYCLTRYGKKDALALTFTVVWGIQLLVATTVHPWYIVPLIGLSVITGYRFPLVWSFFIFLSYLGYTANGYEHPFLMIGIEYLAVGLAVFYDIVQSRKHLSNV
ncbi:glycosyltransferase family 87 protein [Reichenbachiella versicolor]|uniref:glycosyltransferase family 87 protein n=1 Tax=Reichenbachiella versicolor TaxID=1821036 RepID=UPI000D6E82A3|nr:glycosyltransferase family 87 protein [Reichenbachiella versicolor]